MTSSATCAMETNIWSSPTNVIDEKNQVNLYQAVAYLECARGGEVSHILAEKRVLASLYF